MSMTSLEKKSVRHGMQGVFVFVLLGLFALMSTLLALLGAQMYHATVDSASLNNERRVLSAYVRSMARAEDAWQAVRVEPFDGVTALALYEDIEGETYVTRIYQYDGRLWEQFASAHYSFDPEDGTPICAAHSFEPVFENGLLTARMTNDLDEPCDVRVALRCAQ